MIHGISDEKAEFIGDNDNTQTGTTKTMLLTGYLKLVDCRREAVQPTNTATSGSARCRIRW